MKKIDFGVRHRLLDLEEIRSMELAAQAKLAPHALMQRAGLAVAQLALAIAPHAQRIWIACGSGNNGGDGIEAALQLLKFGKSPIVTWLGSLATASKDAAESYRRAQNAGVFFTENPPDDSDFCIDALLGIGVAQRNPEARMAQWISLMNTGTHQILSIDLPSGLQAETGCTTDVCVKAGHTLSLIALKPGLFTHQGRDMAGTIWLDDLGVSEERYSTGRTHAWLACRPQVLLKRHNTHKGSFGDVTVIGGARGMTGAALLTASAALHSGAGRVYVGLLDDMATLVDNYKPELMFKRVNEINFKDSTVVVGCGGRGRDVLAHLIPLILAHAKHCVIDADALNLIALDSYLQHLLKIRTQNFATTVITPHPLEAARLLGISTPEVQQNRLAAAHLLQQRFGCIVVLKGSGTIITEPNKTPVINPTGNGKLATAGTGDVLAGKIGAYLARGEAAFEAACRGVWQHGLAADQWPDEQPLTAGALSACI